MSDQAHWFDLNGNDCGVIPQEQLHDHHPWTPEERALIGKIGTLPTPAQTLAAAGIWLMHRAKRCACFPKDTKSESTGFTYFPPSVVRKSGGE